VERAGKVGPAICRSVSVDYLLHSDGAPQREYAKQAAADGVITYSISASHSAIQANWVERVYDFLGNLLNVEFEKIAVLEQAEYRITSRDVSRKENLTGSYLDTYSVDAYGNLFWKSSTNQHQYGGVQDQERIVHSIGRSLGLSYPDGASWNPAYTQNNSIMSLNSWDNKGEYGHTFFFTGDDQAALQSIHGRSPSLDLITGQTVEHQQRIEEDLLLGINGQKDIFKLTAKGINYNNADARQVEPDGRVWHNDYNVASVANFNPDEGDKILIDKKLFLPNTPINPGFKAPKSFKLNGKTVQTKPFLQKLRLRFIHATSPEADQQAWVTKNNLIYNDAGKLLINANGTASSLTNLGDDLSVNSQLIAFVDGYGPMGGAVPSSWFGLF
jgi:hypothetical protein